jgi:MSHA pilin protein MshA
MKQKGFTLIELIIVIVILGILAVTAAPKFIDIQSDATASTLQGAKAAMQGGAQLVYAKAAIAGVQSQEADGAGNPTVTVNGSTVSVTFGYPDAEQAAALADITTWVDLQAADWTFVAGDGAAAETSPADGSFGVHPAGAAVDFEETGAAGDSCHVLYTNATDENTPPVITVVSGGC